MDAGTAIEMARAALARGDHAAAEALGQAALAAGRDDAEVRHLLGFLARLREDLDTAADHYVAALAHSPLDAHLQNNLAEIRRVQGHLTEAAALYSRALGLEPGSAPIAGNLGSVLLAMHRPDLALPHLERAAAGDPANVSVQSDLAVCLCSLNRYADALPVYRTIYAYHPANNDARYLEALALLALGDYENGWRKHEVRWYARLGQQMRRSLPGPAWTGHDSLAGQTLLLHAEQGHGDTIMFLRYLPALRQMAGRVVLELQPALKPLLDTPGVYARGDDLPGYTTHCSFMSLPFAMRTNRETIPAEVPYLTVPAQRIATWRQRLGPRDGRRRVAIAWDGASAVWNRSIPLRLLAPLLNRPDCEFHVVQTQMSADDCALLDLWPHVIDHSAELGDFADSAAVVSLMDLVISVDTALAHLAGALAQPVWTLLPLGAEYRWLTQGETTPWYPTMRLFRQPRLGDWQAVIPSVAQALDTG